MIRAKTFLTAEEKEKIVAAIEKAEAMSSGEIRVHLATWGLGDPYQKAKKVFQRLGMTRTKDRNGILFFIVVNKHQFVLLGDRGIHEKVHQEFWESLKAILETRFKQGQIADGLIEAIAHCGEQLQRYFPYHEGDTNELSNAIT